MPATLVKSFAKKQGIPVAKVEGYWKKAKEITKKKLKITEKDSNFYKIVVGIVKKMCGIKEGAWIEDWQTTWEEVEEIERCRTPQIVLDIMDMVSEGRNPSGWVEKAGTKWKGEKMSAAEMGRKGGVSTVAVTKAIKNAMGNMFLKAIKDNKGVSILAIATAIAEALGASSSADFADFKKTLPNWVKKEIAKEAKKRKMVREEINEKVNQKELNKKLTKGAKGIPSLEPSVELAKYFNSSKGAKVILQKGRKSFTEELWYRVCSGLEDSEQISDQAMKKFKKNFFNLCNKEVDNWERKGKEYIKK